MGRPLRDVYDAAVRLLRSHLAVVVLVVVVGGVIAALTTASAEIYEDVVERDGIAVVDRPVLDAMTAVRSPALDAAAHTWSWIAGVLGMPVLVAVALVAMGVAWRRWEPVVVVLVAAAGSVAITLAAKPLVGRARPPEEDAVPPVDPSAAFPSGHTLNAVVIAGVVAYVVVLHQRRLAARVATVAGAVAFAVVTALARVYLGHHWFTDVLVAWTVGLAWLAVVVVGHRLHREHAHRGSAGGRADGEQVRR